MVLVVYNSIFHSLFKTLTVLNTPSSCAYHQYHLIPSGLWKSEESGLKKVDLQFFLAYTSTGLNAVHGPPRQDGSPGLARHFSFFVFLLFLLPLFLCFAFSDGRTAVQARPAMGPVQPRIQFFRPQSSKKQLEDNRQQTRQHNRQ